MGHLKPIKTDVRPFVSFNKLPNLPGNENIPPPAEMVEASRMGLYRAKCLPSTLEIIARARRMRKNHPLLRVVYILTDADDRWAEEIRMWLASEGWDRVWIGGGDIYPEYEDREVGVAVDMEVARRAGVFVGNGASFGCQTEDGEELTSMGLVLDDELEYRAAQDEGRDTYRPYAILVILGLGSY